MPRTQKRWLSDTGMVDGVIPISVNSMTPTTGALVITYSALLGLIGTPTASTSNVIQIPMQHLLFRSGMSDDLQEAFGGGATSQVFAGARGLASPPATFSTPAGVSGPPPFTGVTQFTPVTAARPKGIQVNSITFNYLVTTNNTSVNSVLVTDFVYTNAAAVVANSLLASTNLTATAATTPYAQTVALTTPAYLTAVDHLPLITWSVTPGAGGVSIYGVVLNCTFNFA